MPKNPLRIDPTRTQTIVKRFATDLNGRWRSTGAALTRYLVEGDPYGLEPRREPTIKGLIRNVEGFQFLSDTAKSAQFKDWLDQQIQANVLSIDVNGYVESAHKKGKIRAFLDTKPPGLMRSDTFGNITQRQFLLDAFSQGEQLDKIQGIATRSFEALEGISKEMSVKMNRTFADAIAQGKGPRAVARELRDVRISSLLALMYRRAIRFSFRLSIGRLFNSATLRSSRRRRLLREDFGKL